MSLENHDEMATVDSQLRGAEPRNFTSQDPGDSQGRAYGLFLLLIGLVVLLATPYVAGQIRYQTTYNDLRAGVDVAVEGLEELRPRLDDFMLASRLVAKRVGPSLVSIIRPGMTEPLGQGSGFIVDTDGYIVTNNHVVEGADHVRVRLSDDRESTASIVAADAATDVAVLKLNQQLSGLVAAQWGDSDELAVGDLVWALGSPFGLDRSITFGIVSAKERRSPMNLYQEYLQTDAAVNPGNSGGPLVNLEGKVVGINTAIVGPSYQGISFAIPSSLAKETYERLRANGGIERGFLGIRHMAVPLEIQQVLGLHPGEGVLVGVVERGSPAERGGLRVGDVILQWNDHVATDPNLLSRAIAATEIGSAAKVLIARGDLSRLGRPADTVRQELEVVVGSRTDSRSAR
jgi:S1-C subfamily serine protease